MREHSAGEIRQKLNRKHDLTPSDVSALLARLRQDGYQSDTRYTQSMVRSRYLRGQGPMKIRALLSNAQVDSVLVDDAMAVYDDEQWGKSARDQLLKKFSQHHELSVADKAKQMRFLQGRGFYNSHIQAALKACEQMEALHH